MPTMNLIYSDKISSITKVMNFHQCDDYPSINQVVNIITVIDDSFLSQDRFSSGIKINSIAKLSPSPNPRFTLGAEMAIFLGNPATHKEKYERAIKK